MKRWLRISLALTVLVVMADFAVGQWGRSRGRQAFFDRGEVPVWDLHPTMPKDVFTFARVEYYGTRYGGRRSGRYWAIDYPDADLNFSYRLQEMTSLEVHPDGVTLELTDPRLFDYPFIYLVEPGELMFSEEEVDALRAYFKSGGFLMVDDFWGDYEWENFEREIKRVLPDRPIEDLPPDHPIFNLVMKVPHNPQIPNVGQGWESQFTGVTWEPDKNPGAKDPHYRGIFDERGRPLAIICHNTDLGDGWEHEGGNEYYFREFAEKIAYPLGINILFYAMTH